KQRGAERIDIAAQIFDAAVELFRRDVIGCAPDFAGRFLDLIGEHRQAEAPDLGRTAVAEKNIARFNIAMNQPVLKRGTKTTGDLDAHIEDLRLRDAPLE